MLMHVSSDFISKGRDRLTFSNVFWYGIPKFCSRDPHTNYFLYYYTVALDFGKQ